MRKWLVTVGVAVAALVTPADAQLARGILRGPLVVTSGGTPSIAHVGSVFSYTAASTTKTTRRARPTLPPSSARRG